MISRTEAARVAQIAKSLARSGARLTIAAPAAWKNHRLSTTILQIALDTVEELGPCFVKIGQLLATRPDVLPPKLCEALHRRFVRDPKSAEYYGSIATVERVSTSTGVVAVKRIRSFSERKLHLDTSLLRHLAAIVARLVPDIPVRDLVNQMCVAVEGQTDLTKEAETLRGFVNLEKILAIKVPRVLTESDATALHMSWLPDQDLPSDEADKSTARTLVKIVFEMLFVHGTIHCDLHPGNWWVMKDGRIAVVDAGFAYTLSESMMEQFGEFFIGMAAANGEQCANSALAVCINPPCEEMQNNFRREIAKLVEENSGRTAADFSLAEFAAKLFAIQRRYKAYATADFIFPFSALLAIEGQVKELDPGINFQSLASPIVLRGVLERQRGRRKNLDSQGKQSDSGSKHQSLPLFKSVQQGT